MTGTYDHRTCGARTKRAQDERDALKAIVAEMIAHWEYVGTTREDDELIVQWRERAGLEGK